MMMTENWKFFMHFSGIGTALIRFFYMPGICHWVVGWVTLDGGSIRIEALRLRRPAYNPKAYIIC